MVREDGRDIEKTSKDILKDPIYLEYVKLVKGLIMGTIYEEEVKNFFRERGKDVITGNDSEQKENFIGILGTGHLRINEMSCFSKIFYPKLLDILKISSDDFRANFPILKEYLDTGYLEQNIGMNLIIRILLILLENNDISKGLINLEFELDRELQGILSIISQYPYHISNIDKDKVFCLAKMINLGHFKVDEGVLEILTNFIENQLLVSLNEDDKVLDNIGYKPVKKEIIRGIKGNEVSIDEINSVISNGNFTKSPLIITIRNFSSESNLTLILQEKPIIQSDENIIVFNSDKEGFLREFNKIHQNFIYGLSHVDVYSITLYVRNGFNSRPPTNMDLSKLFPSNDRVRLAKAA